MLRTFTHGFALLILVFSMTGCWRAVGNGKIVVAAGVAHPISDIEDLHTKALAKLDALERGDALDPAAITQRQNVSVQDIARLRASLAAEFAPSSAGSGAGSPESSGAASPTVPDLPNADRSALASPQFSALAAAAALGDRLETSPAELISGTRDIYETFIPARLRFKFDSLRAQGYEFFHIPMTLAVHPGNRTHKRFLADVRFQFLAAEAMIPGIPSKNRPTAEELWQRYTIIRDEWKKAGVLDFRSDYASKQRAKINEDRAPLVERRSSLENLLKTESLKETAWARKLRDVIAELERIDPSAPEYKPEEDESMLDTARRWCRVNGSLIWQPDTVAPVYALSQRRASLQKQIQALCKEGQQLEQQVAATRIKLQSELNAVKARVALLDKDKAALDEAENVMKPDITNLNTLRYRLACVVPSPEDQTRHLEDSLSTLSTSSMIKELNVRLSTAVPEDSEIEYLLQEKAKTIDEKSEEDYLATPREESAVVLDRRALSRHLQAIREELSDAFRTAYTYQGLIHYLHSVDPGSVRVLTVSPLRQIDRRAETLARRIQREYAFQFAASGPLGQAGTGAGNLGADRLQRLERDLALIARDPVLTGYVEGQEAFGWRIYPSLALHQNGEEAHRFITAGPRDVMVIVALRRKNWESVSRLIKTSITLPELSAHFDYRAQWIREGLLPFHLRRELPPENRENAPSRYFLTPPDESNQRHLTLGTGSISLTLPPTKTRPSLLGRIPATAQTTFKKSAALLEIVGDGFSRETQAVINNQAIASRGFTSTRIFFPIDPAKFSKGTNAYSVRLNDGPGREFLLAETITVTGKAEPLPTKASVAFASSPAVVQPHMAVALAYKGAKGMNQLPVNKPTVRIGNSATISAYVLDSRAGSFAFTVPVIEDLAQGPVAVTVKMGDATFNVGQILYVNPNLKTSKANAVTIPLP